MIKCLAIDDEPLALRQLASYIKKVPFLSLVGECHSAFDATEIMSHEQIDAIFIDVNMPDLSGLDFVRTLQKPPLVVLTTAYSEYALEGYKIDAVDYLLKPFGMDDFLRAAMKVRKQFELVNSAEHEFLDSSIFVKSEYRNVKILPEQIRYVEGMSEYIRIFTVDLPKPVITLLAMKKLEERLPASKFMRIHRSYIVNLSYIKEVNKNRITLDNDVSLPIGDNYRETFEHYLNNKVINS